VTIAAVLAAYAALAGLLGDSLLRRGQWAARAPLPGIIVWLAAAWSVIAATVLAGLSLAVDSTAIGGQLSRVIGACVIRLRSAYATPGGSLMAWPGLTVTVAVMAWAALAIARYLGTDWRFALRHAEVARVVGRKAPVPGAILVDHEVPSAYCIASRPPTVVVTSGALRALDATHLAAVIAHEHAHLRAHHQLLQALARIARRTAPLLPLSRHADEQVATLIELHADDVATRESGPAPLASALAILATAAAPGPSPGLSATSADVLQRVHRLLRPAPPVSPLRRRLLAAAALVLVVGPFLLALLPAVVALALGKVHTALTAKRPAGGSRVGRVDRRRAISRAPAGVIRRRAGRCCPWRSRWGSGQWPPGRIRPRRCWR
jgi:Zn-dependent protease with chaperone function